MCINFNEEDISEIRRNIRNMFISKTNEKDPILGFKPRKHREHESFTRNHGRQIQKTLLNIIRASPGWEGGIELKINETKLDNYAVNHSKKAIIILECKRNVAKQDGDLRRQLDRYRDIIENHLDKIFSALKLKPGCGYEAYLGVFDAYGASTKNEKYGVRLIGPKDLDESFPTGCVSKAYNSWEREIYDQLLERDISVDKDFSRRMENTPSLDGLMLGASGPEMNCDEPDVDFSKIFKFWK